jgi:two-component system OmpR family sensor kinase
VRIPLRLRLTLAFALGMAILLGALGTFLYFRLGAELIRSIDLGLRSRAQVIVAGIDPQSFPESSGGLIDPDEAFAQILDASGGVRESTAMVAAAPLVPAGDLEGITGPTFLDRATVKGIDSGARLLVVPVGDGTGRLFVVVGATLSDRQEALDRLLVLLAIAGPTGLVVTSLIGWWLAGSALRPVERMRAEAAAISASEPERRLPVPPTGDELARLATTLNAMLTRLQASLARERRFVDDASHELRTPLGVLKAELDLALARARTPEELESALHAASGETDRLARLAEALLTLSRAEGGRLPVHREDVQLAQVIGDACAAHEGRARGTGVRIEVNTPQTMARLDPVRLRQALDNVLDNALRHVPEGGEILVTATKEDGLVRLTVEDSGSGFPEGFEARAFEPFARADASGPGGAAGSGLGLAIVRAVAAAHGGTATAENRSEGGARVTLLLRA